MLACSLDLALRLHPTPFVPVQIGISHRFRLFVTFNTDSSAASNNGNNVETSTGGNVFEVDVGRDDDDANKVKWSSGCGGDGDGDGDSGGGSETLDSAATFKLWPLSVVNTEDAAIIQRKESAATGQSGGNCGDGSSESGGGGGADEDGRLTPDITDIDELFDSLQGAVISALLDQDAD